MTLKRELLTLQDLEEWININNYSFLGYSITDNFINEGYGMEKNGELFQWYYTERGKKETLAYFRTEVEAVQYVVNLILNDEYKEN